MHKLDNLRPHTPPTMVRVANDDQLRPARLLYYPLQHAGWGCLGNDQIQSSIRAAGMPGSHGTRVPVHGHEGNVRMIRQG